MHPATRQAYDVLTARLKEGFYPANSFLPSERELGLEFNLSRTAIRNMVQQLAAAGQVALVPRRGILALPAALTAGCELRQLLVVAAYCGGDIHSQIVPEAVQLLTAIGNAAEKRGVRVQILFKSIDDFDAGAIIRRYRAGEFQAVAFAEICSLPLAEKLLGAGIPLTVVNCETADDIPAVRVDFREIGRTAARELLGLGHRRFGMVNGPGERFIFAQMLAGFRGALAEEGIILTPDRVVELSLGPTEVANPRIGALLHLNGVIPAAGSAADPALIRLLGEPDRPTALLVARDCRAAYVYWCCRVLGIRIPEMLSLVSYDNLTWSEAPELGLTTIAEPFAELGEAALEMLQSWCLTRQRPASRSVAGPLIRRRSAILCAAH